VAVRPILTWPDPALATPCAPAAGGEDAADLIADLFETMMAAPGRGLAAPQVGVLKRVFVMDAGWRQGRPAPLAAVNPTILWHSPETVASAEGCLSLPGVPVTVTRAAAVAMRWQDPAGAVHERRFDGFEAICIQYETDHLDGRMMLDRLDPAARAAALQAAR
jgi:peptide deformylase